MAQPVRHKSRLLASVSRHQVLGLVLFSLCFTALFTQSVLANDTEPAAPQYVNGQWVQPTNPNATAPSVNEQDQLGATLQDTPATNEEGTSIPQPQANSPHSAAEETLRQNLQEQYGQGHLKIEVDSIEPEAGPTTGDTRVLVRGGPFKNMELLYPNPKCKFGRRDMIVPAQYVTCTEHPLAVDEVEGRHANRSAMCLACENNPANSAGPEIVPFSVSLTGDFTDTDDSEPFHYYSPTTVTGIYPKYGPKDGDTFVQVWGENFLNMDQDLRCNFGSKSTVGHFVNSGYITCRSPASDVVGAGIPFSVSLNKQQNSHGSFDYWYYNAPTVGQILPNYGPDTGGNSVLIKGNNYAPFIESADHIDNRNDTFCLFEQVGKVPMRVVNSTKAYCDAPANLNGLDFTFVEVSLNNQNYTDDNVPYYYYKPPKIYDVQPREGPTRGGTVVVVTGSEFMTDKKIVCQFGSVKTRGKLLNSAQLQCIAPRVDLPGTVGLLVTYEGDAAKFGSEAAEYLYYETPVVNSIDPPCGPTYGKTQIVVKGNHFIDMGFGKAKCIFNETHYMNATIIDEQTIKCQTPKLNDNQAGLPHEYMNYVVDITLNGRESAQSTTKFAYYVDPQITGISDSSFGPVHGGTTSKIKGVGFTHPNICNLKIRYGALEVTPTGVSDQLLETVAPQVNVPDAVTLTPSGNGQNYGSDITLHYRDVENTYTYHQDVFVHTLHPQFGPTSGNTKIEVEGMGFKPFKHQKNPLLHHDEEGHEVAEPDVAPTRPIYYKFTNTVTGNIIGTVKEVQKLEADAFYIYSPAAPDSTKAILHVSFNQKDWQTIIPAGSDYSFSYFNAPQVTGINPHFGPVKQSVEATISGKNFNCPDTDPDCKALTVRFGKDENSIFVHGTRRNANEIRVTVPPYTKPDVLTVDVSVNGEDYTNDGVTYGYSDPFLINVTPRLVSPEGSTTLTLHGFGFVNSGEGAIRVKFGDKNGGELTCNGHTPCTVPGTFVDKNTITCPSLNKMIVTKADGTNIGQEGFTVELTVNAVEDRYFWTDNKIQARYYKAPDFKSLSKNSSPHNVVQPIAIETDFHFGNNDLSPGLVNEIDKFHDHGVFHCKWTVDNKTYVTNARMEKLPLGSKYNDIEFEDSEATLPSHLMCPTPKTHTHGQGKLDLSVNGQDAHGNFAFQFTEQLDLLRVTPQAGPKEGNTQVKLIGTGFKATRSDTYAKFGVLATEQMQKDQVVSFAWDQVNYLNTLLMTSSDLARYDHYDDPITNAQIVDSVFVPAPVAPNAQNILGGPVYVSVGQHIDLDSINGTSAPTQQPVSQPQEAQAPAQQATPAQEATPASTTPPPATENTAPASTEPAAAHRLLTAQNTAGRLNYVYQNNYVEYYYYKQPVVKKVEPRSGTTAGGTALEISGAWFDYKLEYGVIPQCMIGEKIVRAHFSSTTRIVCTTPPNLDINSLMSIKVSLNGVNWVNTGFKFSYFELPILSGLSPRSGPMTGGSEIYITGNRFSNITESRKALCKFTMVTEGRSNPGHFVFPKTIPAYYINETTMMCATPNGFSGGDQAYVQLTFNAKDYTEESQNMIFSFYNVLGSFPRSGPSDAFTEVILVRGAGFKPSSQIICQLNNTQIAATEVTPELIKCPMALPGKDPNAIGYVKFSVKIEGSWVQFGDFYYYKQISVYDMSPHQGPAEGRGVIYFYGDGFKDDFRGAELGCKVGESIGQAVLIDSNTMKCTIEEIDLVNEGEVALANVALNSYSWPRTDPNAPLTYVPYGISGVFPSSGPYSGFTDILIQGKGFTEEIAEKAKCRFGVESNYAIVDAEVMDYTKLVCRSPADFHLPIGGSENISVPIGISFNSEEFKPWTEGLHRFRFYNNPVIAEAIPNEVMIGKMAEITLIADEDSSHFFEPVPTGRSRHDNFGILCNFEEFGNSMGMYVNETAILCVSPRIPGDPEDYSEETVKVTVAMNGQDFGDMESDAYVTFIGSGSPLAIWKFIITILLLALLGLGILYCCAAMQHHQFELPVPGQSQQQLQPKVQVLRSSNDYVPRGMNQGSDVLASGNSPPPNLERRQ